MWQDHENHIPDIPNVCKVGPISVARGAQRRSPCIQKYANLTLALTLCPKIGRFNPKPMAQNMEV